MPVPKPLFVWAAFGAVLVLIITVAAVVYYNMPSYDRLIAAIQRGQVEAVKREIALGVDVNRARDVDVPERHSDLFDPMPAYTVYGITPLMEAAGAGEEAMVEALLESGADVAPAANDGKTALHLAAQSVRNLAVLQRLIDAGADVNAGQVRLGWTPLVYRRPFRRRRDGGGAHSGRGRDSGGGLSPSLRGPHRRYREDPFDTRRGCRRRGPGQVGHEPFDVGVPARQARGGSSADRCRRRGQCAGRSW